MNNFIKIEDIVGDVVYFNLDDVSFIETRLENKVIVKFKNSPNEHTFDGITKECIENIKNFPYEEV